MQGAVILEEHAMQQAVFFLCEIRFVYLFPAAFSEVLFCMLFLLGCLYMSLRLLL